MENNKLIAEFMGCIIRDKDGNLPTSRDQHHLFITEEWDKLMVCSPYSIYGVDYHKDWRYLMPVVNDIEDYLADNIGKVGYSDECLNSNNLEVKHQAVVEFIKWYNKNK